jgi:hypothetical protein
MTRRQSEKNHNNTKRPRNTSSIDFPLLGNEVCLMPDAYAAVNMAVPMRIINHMYQLVVEAGIRCFRRLIISGFQMSRRLWLKFVSSKLRRYFQSRSPNNVNSWCLLYLFSWFINNRNRIPYSCESIYCIYFDTKNIKMCTTMSKRVLKTCVSYKLRNGTFRDKIM